VLECWNAKNNTIIYLTAAVIIKIYIYPTPNKNKQTKFQTFMQMEQVDEFLLERHWSQPMINRLKLEVKHIPYRYFLCDDSGSMFIRDGTILDNYG
jgi:hypothetical protein